MRPMLILAFAFLLAAPAQPQAAPTPNKDASKDACLDKEFLDAVRPLLADKDRLKIRLLVENITWSDEYRKAAIDVIESQFANKFVAAPDPALVLYISGTPVVSNGAQYVNVRLHLASSEIVLPENGGWGDLHAAKLGDPTRLVSGWLVLADKGILLAPLPKDGNFELWHLMNLHSVRDTIKETLSEFAAKWDSAGKK